MNSPHDLPHSDRSVSSSPSSGRGWHRVLWGVSLLTMVSLLAMHVALAHSPDLARFVPDRLIQTPASCSSHTVDSALTHGQCSGGALPPAFQGCRSQGYVEPPILTDALYQEGTAEDQSADAPADAIECLPRPELPTGLQA